MRKDMLRQLRSAYARTNRLLRMHCRMRIYSAVCTVSICGRNPRKGHLVNVVAFNNAYRRSI